MRHDKLPTACLPAVSHLVQFDCRSENCVHFIFLLNAAGNNHMANNIECI